MFNLSIQEILIFVPVLVFSFSIHELCHGLTAYKLGDITAKRDGRLSLNPIRHIDPIGLLCILIVGFGWAKPVMVDHRNLKNPKIGMGLIAAAGPLANFVMAFMLMLVLYPLADGLPAIAASALSYGIFINIVLGVFNLLPLPPLDGSKIIAALIPDKFYTKLPPNIDRISMAVFLLLILTGALGRILGPLVERVLWFMASVIQRIF